MLMKKFTMNGNWKRASVQAAIPITTFHLSRLALCAYCAPPSYMSRFIPPRPLPQHRKEDDVDTDEGTEEVNPAEQGVHLAAGRLREPVVDACKQREDRTRRDDVVKMSDHVIGIVEVDVRGCKPERQSRQTADPEHWEERQREQHGRRESNRRAPEREKQ